MFRQLNSNPSHGTITRIFLKSGVLLYAILAIALAGFESFNFSTTQYALGDLLGKLSFAGIEWATILAIAFCGIDFAGIGRLFLPEMAGDASRETWYLFGAWLLAATMNAILTWWGVSMALIGHPIASSAILDRKLILQAVPIFVAIMVWVTRVLLIGSFSMASQRRGNTSRVSYPIRQAPVSSPRMPSQAEPSFNRPSSIPPLRPAARPAPSRAAAPAFDPARVNQLAHPEPEYVDDGETPATGASIPALRPAALSAQPPPQTPAERRF